MIVKGAVSPIVAIVWLFTAQAGAKHNSKGASFLARVGPHIELLRSSFTSLFTFALKNLSFNVCNQM